MAAESFTDIPYSIRRPDRGKRCAMFKRRSELEKFLAVADAGKIVAAADRLAVTRAIARIESRFGAPLFERLSTGVRPTALGAVAALPARPAPRGVPVDACTSPHRASRVATIPLFHACRRHYPGGTGRCSFRSLPGRWQPSPK